LSRKTGQAAAAQPLIAATGFPMALPSVKKFAFAHGRTDTMKRVPPFNGTQTIPRADLLQEKKTMQDASTHCHYPEKPDP
jgi:hypothetical protein